MKEARIAELKAMKQGSGLRRAHLRALDIACSRILGEPPIDRSVPVVCPCDLCHDKVRRHRKYRELPSTGTHGVTLARNRVAWLEEQLTA